MAEEQILATFISQSQDFYSRYHEFYQPLNSYHKEFRLMHILPAPCIDDDVHVTISHEYLVERPHYEAISYTWGPMAPTKQIFIHEIAYNVTENQYAALRRMRSDTVRTMWMDVICINQADLEERGQQVGIMGDIYRCAAQTNVWLGELDDFYSPISDQEWEVYKTQAWHPTATTLNNLVSPKRDDLAEKMPEDVGECACFALKLLAEGIHFTDLPYHTVSGDSVEPSRKWYDCARLVHAILRRPWWNRVWVLQEVLLCGGDSVVLFGHYRLSYETFLTAAAMAARETLTCASHCSDALQDVFIDVSAFANAITRLAVLRKLGESSSPGDMYIEDAARLTNSRNATDIRDHVYGILALVREEDRVDVDYSLSKEQVFSLTSWSLACSRNNFNWLENAGSTSPSWSIDWTHSERWQFSSHSSFHISHMEAIDGDRTWLDGSMLKLPANQIAQVKLVFRVQHEEAATSGRAVLNTITHWLDCVNEVGVISESFSEILHDENNQSFIEFFGTVYRDTRIESYNDSNFKRLDGGNRLDIARYWREVAAMAERGAIDDVEENRDHERRHWWACSSFGLSIQGSVLALTEDHKLCMVPAETESGDFLYHIRTCCPVMVLRSVNESEFHVKGPAFLKGWMGSDGWREDEETIIQLS